MDFNIPIKGRRTLGTLGLYLGYRVAVHHDWIQPMPDIDIAIKCGIVFFFKDGMQNFLKDFIGTHVNVRGDQTVNVVTEKIEVKEQPK